MKKLLVTFAMLLTSSLYASGEFSEVSCWDGTFGYNTFSVVKENGKVILGIAGHQLGPIDFESSFQDHLDIPEWGNNQNAIFMALDESQCVQSEDKLECEAPRPRNGLFVKKNLRDLDKAVEVITPVFLEAVSFTVEKRAQSFLIDAIISEFGNQITLSKSFPNFSTDPNKPCSQLGNGSFNQSSIPPKRLIDFLNKN